MYFLTSLLFFGILLLYYYYVNFLPLILSYREFSSFNLKSLMFFSLNCGDIYFSLSISSALVSNLFFGEVFDVLVILSAILFPIKSLVDEVLNTSVANCLG